MPSITRRKFLAATGATAGAMAAHGLFPAVLRAQTGSIKIGFPRYRGGPMFYADQVGLKKLYADVAAFHTRHGEPWTPAPLLERLAKEGKGFRDFGAR